MATVTTAFGRPGPHIEAEPGDYSASQIANDSDVPGDNVAEVQAHLQDELEQRVELGGNLGGSVSEPVVTGLQGYDVHSIAPQDGDVLTWSEVNSRWEPRASGSTGTLWDVIYDKDLRTLETQPVGGGPGNYIADWRTFTASDGVQWALHTASGAANIEYGVGIRFWASSMLYLSYQNAYGGARLAVACNSLADWNPARRTAVQLKFDGILNVGGQCGATTFQCAPVWGYGPGVNNVAGVVSRVGDGGLSELRTQFLSLDQTGYAARKRAMAVNESMSRWTFAATLDPSVLANRRETYYHEFMPFGVFPALEDMHVIGGSDLGIHAPEHQTYMGFYGGTFDGSTVPLICTHIRVLQKDVA